MGLVRIECLFNEGHMILKVYEQDRGGSGPVTGAQDKDGREYPFPLKPDTGIGKGVIMGNSTIPEDME